MPTVTDTCGLERDVARAKRTQQPFAPALITVCFCSSQRLAE
jgi:hypothetical protein